MKVEQIYTGCLAQGAYYIQSNGEAAIIDPLREVSSYIDKAKKDGAVIKYIFETHFHADFVSGHITLAEQTDSTIVFGPNAKPEYDAYIAKDKEVFQLGDVTIKVLHTPGHTMESTTYLLLDENGKEHAVFTGDTLFLGDVGRPDLAQKTNGFTTNDLAGFSFDSLRNKIMPLPDDVLVYPAHGAGSACGKKMSEETLDTLGNQKKVNYALRADMTKEEFIKEVTEGLLPPPKYFPLNVKMNIEGYPSIEKVLSEGMKKLSPNEFEILATESDAIMLDVRKPEEFANGHIPNSIFIGLDGSFAPWVGELIIDTNQPIILITPEGREEETITRLSRVGFDNTMGYLNGGFQSWKESGKEIGSVDSVSASYLEKVYDANRDSVFDVRKLSEYTASHITNAHSAPLSEINNHFAELPKEGIFFVHCAGGYRSMIASSILKSRGYHNFKEIQKGFKAISETTIPITRDVFPTALKK